MGTKCGDISRLWGQLSLMVSKIKTSPIVGIEYLSHFAAMLACYISKHKRMSPIGFGTTTTGETHELGPLTFSIMSSSTSSFNLLVNLSRR